MLSTVPNEILYTIADNLSPGPLLHLLLTCRSFHNSLSHIMLRHALDDKDCMPALAWASMESHIPLMKTILAHTPASDDASDRGKSALVEACRSGSFEAVVILLDHGVPHTFPKHKGSHPLWLAVASRDISVVRLLLSRGAVPDTCPGYPPMAFDLCRAGDVELLRELLAAGADPNARNAHMSSCLTLAAEYGHLECLKVMLEYGAEINVVDRDNDTPMILALYREHWDVVEFLLEQEECDVLTKNLNGFDPLTLACIMGRANVIRKISSKIALGLDGFWYENDLVPMVSLARMRNQMDVVEVLEEEILKLWLASSMD
ncbi:ankyrin repeat-containing domain protein [Morchella snyderi]|nr:ankyrin repeat-containing domain protein [Morchella snyderi]